MDQHESMDSHIYSKLIVAGRRDPFIIIAALDWTGSAISELRTKPRAIKLILFYTLLFASEVQNSEEVIAKINTTSIMIDTPLEGECYTW